MAWLEFLRTLLEQQPLVALFLTIAIGYLVSEISVAGFSLGVGAVLFVALAVGWFAPGAVPPPMIGTVGLALFLYALGIQYGRQFFHGLANPAGRRANGLALIGVLSAGVASIVVTGMTGLDLGYALGLFAGAGTSTPTLQAAITSLGSDDPAMGYSVAYPVGVAGPMLFLYAAFAFLKPRIARQPAAHLHFEEIALWNRELIGLPLAELTNRLPDTVQIVAVRRAGHNQVAAPDTTLQAGDVLLLTAPDTASLDEIRADYGETAPGAFVHDRSELDYQRVFVSRPSIAGQRLGDIKLPGTATATVMHVRRGDGDLLARPDLVLEFGDRVGLLAPRADFAALRKLFGDSIKGTAEFSYVSIGIGMALGLLVGAIQIPLPGIGTLAFGVAGVLIVALVLGYRRRTWGMSWTIPLSANLVLRNLGLTLFLAQIGMSSGPRFAATIAESGLLMLGLSAVVLIALVLPILLVGLLVFRMPYDELAGVVAGTCGNPAVLAYSYKLAPTDQPELGYAMVLPAMTIVKIFLVNLAAALLA